MRPANPAACCGARGAGRAPGAPKISTIINQQQQNSLDPGPT